VIELGSLRTLGAWAQQDLQKLRARDRWIVLGAAFLCLAAAFAISYAIYRHFGAPRNEYDLNIYFSALNEWRSGGGLYTYVQYDTINGWLGFTYPPVAAIVMSPMTSFSLSGVVVLSSLAILVSVLCVVLLSLRERVTMRRPQLLFVSGLATAAAFSLQPISQTAAYGQVNTFLALLVMFDVFVLGRRGSRWAGIGIGLAMAIKLTPAIFLVYLVVSRQWRMLRVAILTATAATLVAAVAAPSATWQYFTSLLWDSSRVGVPTNTANQSINGALARFTAPLPPDKIAWALCSLAILLIGLRRIRQAVAAGDTLLAVTITGLLGVLVSPVSWIHHAVWIAPAMVVLVSRLVSTFPLRWFQLIRSSSAPFSRLDPAERRSARRWLCTVLLTVTGLTVFVMNTRDFFGLPDTAYAGLGFWAAIAGSVQCIWMLAAVSYLPVREHPVVAVDRVVTFPSRVARVES
jgi:alpha-1,2-mannosyltransferase